MKKKLIKSFRAKKKQVAKKSKFLLRHPLLLPVVTFVALFFIGLFFMVMMGSSTKGASDLRIVNVYADGQQQTVTTRAKNVGDLLTRLEIPLVEQDIVEPKRDTLILEDNTQVNVYRARPVEIVDQDRTFTLFTAQRAPRLVALEAGLNLYPEDDVSFGRIDSTVLESSVSEQLVVDRSVEVKLNLYGAIKLIRTTADTVEELLEKQQISLEDGESLQPLANELISNGLLISVNKSGVKTAVVSEPIDFSTEVVDSPDIEAGKTQIDREGVSGEKAVIYEIIESEGVEISRREIQQVVLREPVNAIRLRGIKIVTPSFSSTETVAGDKAALMEAAGISSKDFGYVDYIVNKESRWRPGVANSSSGAFGLCQALPASKMASAGADYLTNPITQLRWCSGYAAGRYGSWAGAYSAWLVQGWW